MKYRIGVDLGGTKIAIGLVDEEKNMIADTQLPTRKPAEDGSHARGIAADICSATNALLQKQGICWDEIESLGIGVPGTVDQDQGRIVYANNLDFTNVPFVSFLEEEFSNGIRIIMDNDANVAAWAEYKAGAGRGELLRSFFMVTLGTGVGAGIIVDDKIFGGCNQGAGEIGHMVIDMHGIPCNCGRRGCFESYASTTGLMEQTVKAMEQNKESMLWKLCEQDTDKMNGKLFFEAVRQQDQTAIDVLNQFIEYLSVGIINLINIFQPDMMCIGGGISAAGELIMKPLREKISELVYTRDDKVQTRLEIAKLGNEAGVLGAALL